MKNKKGFTLVELIIVVGIVLALAGIATPYVINIITDQRVVQPNAYAKSFYYDLQGILTDIKTYKTTQLEDLHGEIESNAKSYIKIEVDGTRNNGDKITDFTISNSNAFTSGYTGITNVKAELEPYVKSIDEVGTLYASFDNGFRVIAAYWVVERYESDINVGDTFLSDNHVNGLPTGVFPRESGVSGQRLLL